MRVICPHLLTDSESPHAIAHGFFTREGGISQGIYASLNCGPGSNDNPIHVAENRLHVMNFLHPSLSSICTLYQHHSSDVIHLTSPWKNDECPKGDAIVTATPGVAIGILTADCTPVLLADKQAGVIGAAHAGWKGAIGGVLENTVTAMCEHGAKKEHIITSIGPCIRQHSYEVDTKFRMHFLKDNLGNQAFFLPGNDDEHFLFNLPAYVKARLVSCGIEHIHDTAEDTYSQPKRFFSYRRSTHLNEPDYGRQISTIALIK